MELQRNRNLFLSLSTAMSDFPDSVSHISKQIWNFDISLSLLVIISSPPCGSSLCFHRRAKHRQISIALPTTVTPTAPLSLRRQKSGRKPQESVGRHDIYSVPQERPQLYLILIGHNRLWKVPLEFLRNFVLLLIQASLILLQCFSRRVWTVPVFSEGVIIGHNSRRLFPSSQSSPSPSSSSDKRLSELLSLDLSVRV